MANLTKDPVNQYLVEEHDQMGLETLGVMNSSVWRNDPKRLLFTLARYKFVGRMLNGKSNVIEIGCGDGFGSRIVKQHVDNLLITDYDPLFIDNFSSTASKEWLIKAEVHDIIKEPTKVQYDALYSLDVFEHIGVEQEDIFLVNVCKSLTNDGVAIIGIPSLESQQYASPQSKQGHVNCKTGKEFKNTLSLYFSNVFLFSMNDEVVHTGFAKMAHYLICICCSPSPQ